MAGARSVVGLQVSQSWVLRSASLTKGERQLVDRLTREDLLSGHEPGRPPADPDAQEGRCMSHDRTRRAHMRL